MYRFVVCGRGAFPVSMLDKQDCYPVSIDDYRAINFNPKWLTISVYSKIRYITLDSINLPKESMWQTFGWKVIR